MRTILVEKKMAKMALVKALRPVWPGVVFSPLSPTRLADLPEVDLPGPRWVRVRNRLSGICGSDLHLLCVEADLRVSAAALPGSDRMYLGHEALGEVIEVGPGVTRLVVGDRVILDAEAPNCLSREIEPPCRHCREGNYLLCENASVEQGELGVGGGWGDSFTAHESGVYRVPDGLSDEAALMIEPLSVGVRTVLQRLPQAGDHALVVGCSTIGLGVVMALRALAPGCHITVLARYPQQVEMARKLGADEIVSKEDTYLAAARITQSKLYTGTLNNRMLLGGFDVVYDCVGSGRTVTDSLRWSRAGGAVVLAGVTFAPLRVDLSPVWYQEVDLLGLYGHGMEEIGGSRQSTYDLTRDLLLSGRLTIDGLITHRFPLAHWQAAVRTAMDKRSGAIKVVLDCRDFV